jgi:hypothetical protein
MNYNGMTAQSTTVGPKPLRVFDHAAFYPTIRPTDVFLCTYPKSGTTWLGYLIAQVLKLEPDEQIDLKSFNRYVPDVNFQLTKRGSLKDYADSLDPRFFLCHATYDEHLPKVVYVMRDPRDVMLSYWHYKKFLSKDFKTSLAEYLAGYDHWPCEWDQHVASWLLPRQHPNLLVLKYEDLHSDTAAVLRNVLQFADRPFEDDRIVKAVEASGFDRMRQTEEKFGVHGKAGDEKERFVRKGQIGSWREEMTQEEIRIIEEKYGQTMRAVGYEPQGMS